MIENSAMIIQTPRVLQMWANAAGVEGSDGDTATGAGDTAAEPADDASPAVATTIAGSSGSRR